MRCKKVREMLVFQDRTQPLPSSAADHLAACESCRQYMKQDLWVRQALTLKKYEYPSAGSEERTRRAVRQALAEQWNPTVVDSSQSIWTRFFAEPLPALRYAVAALLLLLVSIHQLNMPELGTSEPPLSSVGVMAPALPENTYVADAGFQPPGQGPRATDFQVVSNRGGGLMEYGPYRSVPVSFDY